MSKNYDRISIKPETKEEIMLLKIQCKAKSLDEVLSKAIKLLKQKLKGGRIK